MPINSLLIPQNIHHIDTNGQQHRHSRADGIAQQNGSADAGSKTLLTDDSHCRSAQQHAAKAENKLLEQGL